MSIIMDSYGRDGQFSPIDYGGYGELPEHIIEDLINEPDSFGNFDKLFENTNDSQPFGDCSQNDLGPSTSNYMAASEDKTFGGALHGSTMGGATALPDNYTANGSDSDDREEAAPSSSERKKIEKARKRKNERERKYRAKNKFNMSQLQQILAQTEEENAQLRAASKAQQIGRKQLIDNFMRVARAKEPHRFE